jgi:2'-5' RNA ligase
LRLHCYRSGAIIILWFTKSNFNLLMSKRLFIAVHIPVLADIIELSQKLKQRLDKGRINWVPLHNFHLTLKFLGDADEVLIPEIVAIMQQVANEFEAFDVGIEGLGKFSSSGHAKVIWLGIEDTKEVLNALSIQLNNQLAGLGFKPETRPFRAHLTLARVKNIHNQSVLNNLIHTYSHTHFQNHKVKDIILYQSILKPSGPVYKPLITVPL